MFEGRPVLTPAWQRLTNQTKSRKKQLPFPTRKGKPRQKCCSYFLKIVPQLGCVSQDSESLDSQRGGQSRRNPMQQVSGPLRRVRFTQSTLRQASIQENEGPSLGQVQVKNPQQRSPYAVKFEDRSQETERQQRCAQSKAWNLVKNIYKLKEKDKAPFYSPFEEWVLPVASTRRAGRKRVCGRFRSEHAYGQQERL